MARLLEIDPTFSLDSVRRTYLPSSGRDIFLEGLKLAGAPSDVTSASVG